MPSSERHDYHHLKFNQNYGTIGLFDYLHGTDSVFRSEVGYKRHVPLYTTRSAREVFPDEKKD